MTKRVRLPREEASGIPERSDDRSAASRRRLDTVLAERGLFESRSRAAASVMAGEVRLGVHGRRAEKPGELVDPTVTVRVDAGPDLVSRGGRKLARALDGSGLDVSARLALDLGASTGGFTDCLLQRGASHVVAVDVAYGELHWRLRTDERVTVLERTNARHLEPQSLPYRADVLVADLAFISLTLVLPAALPCLAPRYDALVMVKPQFEVGRGRVGHGGVVRDAAARREALLLVARHARSLGAEVLGMHPSGLPGPKGNRETFLHLAEAGRPGGARDDSELAGLAGVAEP